MDANRRIVGRRQIYDIQTELVDEYVSHGGHARVDLSRCRWINTHLKHEKPPQDTGGSHSTPSSYFSRTTSLPGDAINSVVDEVFVRSNVALPQSGVAGWKNDLVKARALVSFVSRACLASSTRASSQSRESVEVLGTEPERVLDSVPTAQDDRRHGALVLNPGDTVELLHVSNPMSSRVLLCARAAWRKPRPGRLTDDRETPAGQHVLIGQTVDEGRVRDIAATLAYLKKRPTPLDGDRADPPAYSALCRLVRSGRRPGRRGRSSAFARQGPIFLNVLQVLDIPDALGLLLRSRWFSSC